MFIMRKYKILIVSRSFYPEISPRAFRTTELVKELARQGHDVTLYTIKDDKLHPEFEQTHKVVIKNLGVIRYRLFLTKARNRFLSLLGRIINRVLLMLFEYPDIELYRMVVRSLKHEKGYDLLISVAVPFPVHWGVAKCVSANRSLAATWVADCGDPYMGNTNDSFRKLFYFSYVEKWFCRIADYITIPKIEMKATYYPEFHDKIREIPQGFDFGEIKLSEKKFAAGYPSFAFAGSFIKVVRDPAALLEFLSKLNQPFRFVVYTRDVEYLAPYRDKLGDKLVVRDYIPRLDLIAELSEMDFLINIAYDPVKQSPSKLIDYALTARPILSLASNEVDETVFKNFLQGDYTGQFVVGNIQKYNIQNVARQFLELAN